MSAWVAIVLAHVLCTWVVAFFVRNERDPNVYIAVVLCWPLLVVFFIAIAVFTGPFGVLRMWRNNHPI